MDSKYLPPGVIYPEGEHLYIFPLVCMDLFLNTQPQAIPPPMKKEQLKVKSKLPLWICEDDVVFKELSYDYSRLPLQEAQNKFVTQFTKIMNEVQFCNSILPNVVGIKGFCRNPIGLVMDYYNEGSLYDYLETMKKLDIRSIITDIVKGMKSIHDLGKMHCNLKSKSILLKRTSHGIEAFISGLSKCTSQSNNKFDYDNPYYLPPEVINGCNWTQESDVYSFGVLCWEIITRKHPYEGKPFDEIKTLINRGHLDFPSDPSYNGLLTICWKIIPQERPSFTSLMNMLDKGMKFDNENINSYSSPVPKKDVINDVGNSMFDSSSSTDDSLSI